MTSLLNDGPGFERFARFYGAQTLVPQREIYVAGSGPAVIVMHELYGATPALFRFAYRILDAGFSVYVPILFGQADHPGTGLYALQQATAVCISHEFAVFAANSSSPITDWLRSLARILYKLHGARGIAAIGLCLTGNFALSMMLIPETIVPVVCEPALPFSILPAGRRALHLSPENLAAIKARSEEGRRILTFRFDGDRISPAERYENFKQTFGNAIIGDGYLRPTCPNAHAVFTEHYDDRAGSSTRGALDNLLRFLRDSLTTV